MKETGSDVVAHVTRSWLAEPALAEVMVPIMESGDVGWLVHVAIASLRTLPVDQRMEVLGMTKANSRTLAGTYFEGPS